MKNMIRKILPLLFALIINGAGHAYFIITLPVIGRSLTLDDLNIALILSLSSLLLVLTGPLWGWLCDKIGRRQVLMIGLITSAASTLAIAGLVDFGSLMTTTMFSSLLFTIRSLQAAMSAGLKPATQATAADVTQQHNRISAMGLMGACFAIGTILGGVIAMISGSDYLVQGFAFIGSLMLLSSLWVTFALPETQAPKSHKSERLSLPPFIVYWITTLTGLCIYSALQPITSWRLQDAFSLAPNEAIKFTGAIMMSSMLAMICAQLSLLKWKISPHKMRLIGLILSSLALLTCMQAGKEIVLLFGMVLLGIGFGLFLPANLALMSIKASADQQGKVAGINGMSQGAGLTLGPLGGATLYKLDPSLPYQVALISIILLLVISIFSLRKFNKE